jgi:hypothetical protein
VPIKRDSAIFAHVYDPLGVGAFTQRGCLFPEEVEEETMRKIAMLVGVVALMSVVVASVALAAGQHSAGQPKAARRQRLPYLLSAVKLLEDAPEMGSELRKGYVITNQHWQRIVEKSKR